MLPLLCRPSTHLLPAEAAPQHIRAPYILYYYRPKSVSWRSGALTLFRLHNETLNIWSHLLGAVWVLAMLLEIRSTPVSDEGQRHATVVYLLSALFCTASSTLYHLFGGILSRETYARLFNLDINGISVVIAGSYYPGALPVGRSRPGPVHGGAC